MRVGSLMPGWLAVLAVGCGPSNDSTVPVKGTVTWNGNALLRGNINFLDADGKLIPDAGEVIDGKFALRVKPGRKRVEIFANREGRYDPVMKAHEREQYLPDRYNARSVLTADVQVGQDNEFHYPLTDQP